MKIVGITGKAQHGKTTVANMIRDTLVGGVFNPTVGIFPISYPFKLFWADAMGLVGGVAEVDAIKSDRAYPYDITHRQALEQLGDWGRAIDKHFWFNSLENIVTKQQREGQLDYLIIPDVRVEDEAQWVRDRAGFMVHVVSNTLPTIDSTHTVQTTPVEMFPSDYVIQNDGSLSDLLNQVVQMIHREHG